MTYVLSTRSELHCGKVSLSWSSNIVITNWQELNKKYNKGSLNLTHPYMLTSTKITIGLEGTAVKGGVSIFYGCCNKLP